MKQYSGAVFFVDMLGIGALTQGKVPLSAVELDPWKVPVDGQSGHQLLAAKLLTQFRTSLRKMRSRCAVKVAQLSDCAFIWSPEADSVALAARVLMTNLTLSGLLCRGGMAYGQIVEPSKVDRSLGSFILGDAVTRAAGLESRGKGCRIFCDREIAHQTLELGADAEDFAPLKNPLDGAIVDEFRWYIVPKQGALTSDANLERAISLVNLVTMLRHSPRFSWNTATLEGRVQVACSVEAISAVTRLFVPTDDYVYNAEYMIDYGDVKRSDVLRAKMLKRFTLEVRSMLAKRKRSSAGSAG